jgi:hypothetical protein
MSQSKRQFSRHAAPPQRTSVHSGRPIPQGFEYRYPMSGEYAHVKEVSQVSSASTDLYLLARNQGRPTGAQRRGRR